APVHLEDVEGRAPARDAEDLAEGGARAARVARDELLDVGPRLGPDLEEVGALEGAEPPRLDDPAAPLPVPAAPDGHAARRTLLDLLAGERRRARLRIRRRRLAGLHARPIGLLGARLL